MECVDICSEKDLAEVAVMHASLSSWSNGAVGTGLVEYYRKVFFENPWRCDDLRPLVYRSPEGKVTGFIGVIPFNLVFDGRPIRASIAHRFMVAPRSNSQFAAVKLMRRFQSGPQDLSIGDGANDAGRKFWEGVGGTTSLLYSMNWLKPLKPLSYAATILKKKHKSFLVAPVSLACRALDLPLSCLLKEHFRPTRPNGYRRVDLDHASLLACINEFSIEYALRPEYSAETMKWLWEFLESNKQRGRLKGSVIVNKDGENVGAYLYYMKRDGVAEVMALMGRKNARNCVFEHLLCEVIEQDGICVMGRMEPKFLQCFWDHNCLVKRGCWALLHSKRPEIIDAINRCDAFLTSLEGELWLRSPRDILA